ncbi:hypothetical protein ABZ318_29575 [Streptomyces sp. NPDC006197]|uniref:hypothetical protein n=1 Tax=Streptomyces sp. NPDC006197 TaxID=3156685 RepID=UPI0033B72F26
MSPVKPRSSKRISSRAYRSASPIRSATGIATVHHDHDRDHDRCEWKKDHWEQRWVKGHWEKKVYHHKTWHQGYHDDHRGWHKGYWDYEPYDKWVYVPGHWEHYWVKAHWDCRQH